METLKGIKYINSGGRRYLRIDLDMYKDNELLEDFLDSIDIEARKNEPVYPFEEVMKAEFERRGLKYDV
ncbi:MAG: hypothetical protein LBC98_02790 [Prevotellaceae bacterium]|nr:hypothetical protein [Prevotellaceae bacterium]